MNLLPVLARAFGVDPTRFEALVAAYESPGCRLCEDTGKVGATPCPLCDRLALIERRHVEAGCGDADKGWLLAECKRLRGEVQGRDKHIEELCRIHRDTIDAATNPGLDEALNSGDGSYRP